LFGHEVGDHVAEQDSDTDTDTETETETQTHRHIVRVGEWGGGERP
jgi:hypothetical protein